MCMDCYCWRPVSSVVACLPVFVCYVFMCVDQADTSGKLFPPVFASAVSSPVKLFVFPRKMYIHIHRLSCTEFSLQGAVYVRVIRLWPWYVFNMLLYFTWFLAVRHRQGNRSRKSGMWSTSHRTGQSHCQRRDRRLSSICSSCCS